jgi:hypothetical protein
MGVFGGLDWKMSLKGKFSKDIQGNNPVSHWKLTVNFRVVLISIDA